MVMVGFAAGVAASAEAIPPPCISTAVQPIARGSAASAATMCRRKGTVIWASSLCKGLVREGHPVRHDIEAADAQQRLQFIGRYLEWPRPRPDAGCRLWKCRRIGSVIGHVALDFL